MSFLAGLKHVLKTGFELTDAGQEYNRIKRDKEDYENRRRMQDIEMAEHFQGRGARPVINGVVKRDLMSNGPVQMRGSLMEKADPSRTVKWKTADGEKVAFELPSREDQIQQSLQYFMDEEPVRAMKLKERQTEAEQTAAATYRGRLGEEQKQRDTIGVSIPPDIAQDLGMDPNRKFMPAEVDDLIRSAGTFANQRSQIEARNKPKERKIQSTHTAVDDAGKQVQVLTYDDGTVVEKPLEAKGKTARAETGGLTPWQNYQMANNANKEREGRITSWQNKVDGLQAKQSAIVQETEALSAEHDQLSTDIASKAFKGAQLASARRRLATIEGKITGNHAQHEVLESQKKGADVVRRSLLGEQPAQVAPSKQQTGSAAGGAVVVTDPRGVEHTFPDQASANKFKQLAGIK